MCTLYTNCQHLDFPFVCHNLCLWKLIHFKIKYLRLQIIFKLAQKCHSCTGFSHPQPQFGINTVSLTVLLSVFFPFFFVLSVSSLFIYFNSLVIFSILQIFSPYFIEKLQKHLRPICSFISLMHVM